MKLKFLLIATFTLASAKSLSESQIKLDDDSNFQIRDKREPELTVLDELVKSGVAKKRNAEADSEKQSGKTLQEEESKAPVIPKIALSQHENPPGQRVKKQSPVVCIKLKDCGKTACGPFVSAYGPGVGELRNYMQGNPAPNKEMVGNVLDEIDTPKMNPPMDYNRMNPPMMDFNRMLPPNEFSRMNPNDFSRMNPPTEFSRMNPPTEFSRMNPPTEFNRMNPPTEFNRMNPPTEFNRMNPPAEFNRMNSDNQRTQPKTFDLLGYNPFAIGQGVVYTSNSAAQGVSGGQGGSSGYGVPSGSANSFWKPEVITPALVEVQHPLPVHHPLLSHHPLMALNAHRIYDYPSRIQQPFFLFNDYRQPPQPAYNGYDTPEYICHRNKQYQNFAQDKIDNQVDDRIDEKQLNATEPAGRMTDGSDDGTEGSDSQVKSVQEHLRKINEIKDQISDLNRAAQKIVDQQEKFAELQQRHMSNGYKNGNGAQPNLYNGQSEPSYFQRANNYDERAIPPYYGSYYPGPGYYSGGFGRASPASYPNTQEDTEFFMNLMHNLKRLGLLSNSFQQSIIAPVDDKNGQQKNKESEDLVADLLNGDKQEKKTQTTTNTKNDKNKKQKENQN